MEVILAKSAGFCPGVQRAVNMVYEQTEIPERGPVYTYGPIIHNDCLLYTSRFQRSRRIFFGVPGDPGGDGSTYSGCHSVPYLSLIHI